MLGAPIPANEAKRLEMLEQFEIIDSDFESSYDQIVELASKICQTPISLISLLDEKRQWFKAKVGLDVRETPRELAFCGYAVYESSSLIVKDTWEDERFKSHPLVLGEPKIRFYAGFPIQTSNGLTLGTVCAIDRVPRVLTKDQTRALEILADQVKSLMDLRLSSLKVKNYLLELEEASLLKSKFLSLISHDLRAPFNGLIGFSSILKDQVSELSSEEIRSMAEDIHSSANQVYSLLNNLLEWSLLERGLKEAIYSEVELKGLIENLQSLFQESLLQKNISFVIDSKSFLGTIRTDDKMLQTILRNLISNAIKFTPKSGKITVSFRISENNLSISIQDTGVGMNQEKVALLFGKFNSTSTQGTAGEIGSGLGLTLCKQLLDLLQGRIRVESTIGKGTRFDVELPLT